MCLLQHTGFPGVPAIVVHGAALVFPYAIDRTRNVVLVTMSGTIRASDIATTMETLYSDPAWVRGLESIWDGTNIVELVLEARDMPGFLALDQRYAAVVGSGRIVVVVTRPIDKIMAHIYATMARTLKNRTVHLCTTIAEASEILRLPHA